MCQECLELEERMRQENKAQALLDSEDKPQTLEQCIFWLEIGGYYCHKSLCGYLVAYPDGIVEALSVEDMRYKAIDVWWVYQLI